MPIQLPRRRDVRGNRKFSQPITRRNIQAVQGRPDPGAQGGPNAAATPLAFGGGGGLIDAGEQLQQLGAQWRKAELQRVQQKNALDLERAIIYMDEGLGRIMGDPRSFATQNTRGQIPTPPFRNNNTTSSNKDFIDDKNVLNTRINPHWDVK
tara:strand:- start:5150 stop:5605 length:456 start_codon:yes stop_codon:yes gene_type:complete